MSPRKVGPDPQPQVQREALRAAVRFGEQARDARRARGWSVRQLAAETVLSPDMIYRVEAGRPASVETYARISVALGRRLEIDLIDPHRTERTASRRPRDLVHSAMGEFEAGHFRRIGFGVGLDEPYQHFQFAGRADFVAWDLGRRLLLHIENRTRFPDFQDMAGAYNAKRAYLGSALAKRLGIARWFAETHVIAALWSSEVLHALRLRPESFRSLCPGDTMAFTRWWTGALDGVETSTSTLIVLDPLATGRARPFIGLADALTARPRHRGYAEAAGRLGRVA